MTTIVFPAPPSPGVELLIIVPVYKEEANIRPFLQRTEAVMAKMEASYEIIFPLSLDLSLKKSGLPLTTEFFHRFL